SSLGGVYENRRSEASGNTKTNIVVAHISGEPKAHSQAPIAFAATPGAAAGDATIAVGSGIPRRAVGRRPLVARVIAIADPLPCIAIGVMQAKGIWFLLPHRCARPLELPTYQAYSPSRAGSFPNE